MSIDIETIDLKGKPTVQVRGGVTNLKDVVVTTFRISFCATRRAACGTSIRLDYSLP